MIMFMVFCTRTEQTAKIKQKQSQKAGTQNGCRLDAFGYLAVFASLIIKYRVMLLVMTVAASKKAPT